jgi:dimethylhistidine N-methyltransferase
MTPLGLQDLAPSKQQFLADVLAGLRDDPKQLPCKYLYDARGSALFDQICRLDEYYLTRAELEILRTRGAEIAECLGQRCVVVEYGSGSSLKTRELLASLANPVALVPVDISRDHLAETAALLAERFPNLTVRPVCADFTRPFELPAVVNEADRTIVYFSGSTIGNFHPEEAVDLVESMGVYAGRDGGLLIGVDLQKPRAILEQAYNDSQRVTAAFNINLLERANRELDTDFCVEQFRHQAVYNECEHRIEMHLVSEVDQVVLVDGVEVMFSAGESIHTENSYKYSTSQFASLAARAGFDVRKIWFDSREAFSLHYLTRRSDE